MTNNFWQDFLAITAISAIFAMLLSMLLLRLTLDRRVRKALPLDKNYDNFTDWYFGIGRAITFGWACVLPFINNSERLRSYYDDMDIRAFANRFEFLISYTMAISLVIFIICLVVAYVTNWLGIFEWSGSTDY